jgi:hypothetical protein
LAEAEAEEGVAIGIVGVRVQPVIDLEAEDLTRVVTWSPALLNSFD